MLDVELTFRMIHVLQQRRPGEKGSPLQKEPFHHPAKKRVSMGSWNGVQKAKDAKNAKMHVFVHFAQIPL